MDIEEELRSVYQNAKGEWVYRLPQEAAKVEKAEASGAAPPTSSMPKVIVNGGGKMRPGYTAQGTPAIKMPVLPEGIGG